MGRPPFHFLEVGDRVRVHRQGDAEQHLDITASIDNISHFIGPISWLTTITLSHPVPERTAYPEVGHGAVEHRRVVLKEDRIMRFSSRQDPKPDRSSSRHGARPPPTT